MNVANHPPNPPPRRSRAVYWVSIIVLLVFLVTSLMLNFALFVALAMKGGSSLSSFARGEDEYPRLIERWSYGSGHVKAVRISISGIIARETGDGLFGPKRDRIESVLSQIRAARHDKDVRLIIMEVDSPGGSIAPSDEIYHALMNFKRSDEGRKVLVFTRDLAASGGYYIGAAGDYIIAEPTALIGSIGVIMQTLNWKGLSEKIGVKDTVIKSGINKDLLNPFRDVSPEQVALLQEVIDDMYARFLDIVIESRGLEREAAKTLADGRVFSAQDALKEGLVDQLGYWDDVVAQAAVLTGASSVRIVRYLHEPSLSDWFLYIRYPFTASYWRDQATPRLMYLWRP